MDREQKGCGVTEGIISFLSANHTAPAILCYELFIWLVQYMVEIAYLQ